MAATRDIYESDVDFTALALQYLGFAKKLKPNKQLDFSDPESVRQLTKSLLHRDFNIAIDLPDDRLCPPVPNRFNYILWLQDLLDATNDDYRDKYDPDREVVGLDIGTGASCIYPLLACRQRPNWKLVATEIDDKSLAYAQRNVQANRLEERVKVLKTEIAGPLIPAQVLRSMNSIDFTMLNPPFYASEKEMLESAKAKQRPPNSACTGAAIEMICPGGEVAFVMRLVEESRAPEAREKVQWFTSMLGKFASVGVLVDVLKGVGCGNWAVKEFVQGGTTRRWGLAWSWMGRRAGVEVARGCKALEKKWLPWPSEFIFEVDGDMKGVGERVAAEVSSLDARWQWRGVLGQGLGMAERDVWSRKARRRREDDTQGADEMDEGGEVALVFKISLKQLEGGKRVEVNVRWMQGKDSVLFESFCGWLKRKVESR